MARRAPDRDIDENDVEVGHPKQAAAGIPAVAVSMKRAIEQHGCHAHGADLLKLNQVDGFDCQGCAWPDPDPEHRHTAEFCENGAKAVAEEATTDHVGRTFFAEHSIEDLQQHTDYWLGHQGRLVHPMVRRRDGDALRADLLGRRVRADRRDAPRARLARRGDLLHLGQDLQRGGVRLPAVRPRLRHQQPAGLLEHVPRVDLGRARRDDRHRQGLGAPGRRLRRRADRDQRPEPRHQPPADADRAREGQAERRQDPGDQPARRRPGCCGSRTRRTRAGVSGIGTGLADLHLPIRINGDLALWQAIGALLLEAEEARGRRQRARPRLHRAPHDGFAEWAREIENLDWDGVDEATGLTRGRSRRPPTCCASSRGDRALLGDGHHPAPQRRRHDQGVRQRRAAAGQHRQARCRAVPGARPLQRAGRPHHGHLGEGARPLPRRAARRVRLRAAARARSRHRRRDPGAARRQGQGVRRDGRQLRLGRARHVVTEEAMEQAELTVRSRRSSTARTCAAAGPR